VVLVAALGLLGAGVACGDSKGVSKADYLARAREVCQRGSAALTAASNEALAKVPPGQKLSGAAIDEFVRQTVVPTIREQIKELRGLEAPKGEKAHVDEIYSSLEKGLDELQQTPSKLTDGSNVFAAANTLAEKYGISVCATTG